MTLTDRPNEKPPSMADEKAPDLNQKLLARMKQELDNPAPPKTSEQTQPPPRAVVEMRARAPEAERVQSVKDFNASLKPIPAASHPSDYAPPNQRPDTVARALGPLPPYLTHAPDASRAAQIASHAIGVEYETLALECERKGLELHDRINAVLQDTIETARYFRERGAALFRQIETSFALAAEVAEGNKKMRERIVSVEHIESRSDSAPAESMGLPPSATPPESIPDVLAEKIDTVVRETKEAQRGV